MRLNENTTELLKDYTGIKSKFVFFCIPYICSYDSGFSNRITKLAFVAANDCRFLILSYISIVVRTWTKHAGVLLIVTMLS